MAHKIQESAEGSKQAELRMEKKKPYWIYRSHRCARIFRETLPFLYSRYFFFSFPVLYSLTRSLSWYLGNSYKSEKFSSRVSSGRSMNNAGGETSSHASRHYVLSLHTCRDRDRAISQLTRIGRVSTVLFQLQRKPKERWPRGRAL